MLSKQSLERTNTHTRILEFLSLWGLSYITQLDTLTQTIPTNL